MMDRVRILWGTWATEKAIGNLYGYRTHNNIMLEHVSRIAEITPDAPDAIFIATPELLKSKIPDKRLWWFTMWEGLTMPDIYRNNLKNADYLLTPSNFVKNLFSEYFDPNNIYVIPEGVEPIFTFKRRKIYSINQKFRYLWVGAPNPRKGWIEMVQIWDKAKFMENPNVELYIKTSGIKKEEGVEKRGNVILDNRNLSRQDLVKLYHDSHCFVWPTHGEGFGLCLAEAMATGLPCICTNFSGVTDFFNEDVGFPVNYKIGDGEITDGDKTIIGKTRMAYPDVVEIAYQMEWIRRNYDEALDRARRGSFQIRNYWTWDRAARILVDTVGRVQYGQLDN